MRLMRSAAFAAIARRLYTEARKPSNQARIKHAVQQVQARRAAGKSSGTHRAR